MNKHCAHSLSACVHCAFEWMETHTEREQKREPNGWTKNKLGSENVNVIEWHLRRPKTFLFDLMQMAYLCTDYWIYVRIVMEMTHNARNANENHVSATAAAAAMADKNSRTGDDDNGAHTKKWKHKLINSKSVAFVFYARKLSINSLLLNEHGVTSATPTLIGVSVLWCEKTDCPVLSIVRQFRIINDPNIQSQRAETEKSSCSNRSQIDLQRGHWLFRLVKAMCARARASPSITHCIKLLFVFAHVEWIGQRETTRHVICVPMRRHLRASASCVCASTQAYYNILPLHRLLRPQVYNVSLTLFIDSSVIHPIDRWLQQMHICCHSRTYQTGSFIITSSSTQASAKKKAHREVIGNEVLTRSRPIRASFSLLPIFSRRNISAHSFVRSLLWNAEKQIEQKVELVRVRLHRSMCECRINWVHSPVVNGTPVSPVIGGASARANEINPTVLSSMNTAANECTVKCHNDSCRFCWFWLHRNVRCVPPPMGDASWMVLVLLSHCPRRFVVAMGADVLEDTTIFSPTVAAALFIKS